MDIIKEFGVEKDTVVVLETRRLLHFGHVIRMNNDIIASRTSTWIYEWQSD